MEKPRVFVSSSGMPEAGFKVLQAECDVVVPGPNPTRQDLVEHVKGVDALLWCCMNRLDAEIIDAAGPGLRAVSTISSGYNHIDVQLLKKRGIPFGNTAHAHDDAVADAAMALVLSTKRRLQEGRHQIEQGRFVASRPQTMLGRDVAGNIVGIVGLGGIGQAFAKRINAFNIAGLYYCGHRPKPEAERLGAEFVSFDKLVEMCDIIVLACPLTQETRNLFNADVFKKMKPSAILVSVVRTECIDHAALVEALKTNTISGAGLDEFSQEDIPELLSLNNCVLFPHVGSATEETRSSMARLAATNVVNALKGKPMPSPVV